MKTLQSILEQEKKENNIASLAKDFKFKNMRLFLDEVQSPSHLNLMVDVDYENDGDANNANLLEAKLTEILQVDTVVIVKSKVKDANDIESGSFTLQDSEKNIEKILKEPIERIFLKTPEKVTHSFRQRLEFANEELAKKRKMNPINPEGSTSHFNQKSTTFFTIGQPEKNSLSSQLMTPIPKSTLASVPASPVSVQIPMDYCKQLFDSLQQMISDQKTNPKVERLQQIEEKLQKLQQIITVTEQPSELFSKTVTKISGV